jgi:hypothetical protein
MILIALIGAVIVTAELWRATPFVRVAMALPRLANLSSRTFRSRHHSDDLKQHRLLKYSGLLLQRSLLAAGLLFLYAAPVLFVVMIFPDAWGIVAEPWILLLLVLGSLGYLFLRRRTSR